MLYARIIHFCVVLSSGWRHDRLLRPILVERVRPSRLSLVFENLAAKVLPLSFALAMST